MKPDERSFLVNELESIIDKIFPNISLTSFSEFQRLTFRQIILEPTLILKSDFQRSRDLLTCFFGQKLKRNTNIILWIPFGIALLITLHGLFNSDYWLLLSVPVAFVGFFLSSLPLQRLAGTGFIFGLASVFQTIAAPTTLSLIGLSCFLSWIFSAAVRIYIHKKALSTALLSEKIFCSFYKTGSLYVIINGQVFGDKSYQDFQAILKQTHHYRDASTADHNKNGFIYKCIYRINRNSVTSNLILFASILFIHFQWNVNLRDNFITLGFFLLSLFNLSLYVYRKQNPKSHPVMKNLAQYGEDPFQIAEIISYEASKKATVFGDLTLTEHWFIDASGFNFQAFRASDLIWGYKKQTSHQTNFIETHKTFTVELIFLGNISKTIQVRSDSEATSLLEEMHHRAPWAIYGYSDETKRVWSRERISIENMVLDRQNSIFRIPKSQYFYDRPQKASGQFSSWVKIASCFGLALFAVSAAPKAEKPVSQITKQQKESSTAVTQNNDSIPNPPSEEITFLAKEATMTDVGLAIFLSQNPQIIVSKADLLKYCSNNDPAHEKNSILMGCRSSSNHIYIYSIENEKIKGIMTSTAAHEMLHAAYERLSPEQRNLVDAQIVSATLNLRQDLRDRLISLYPSGQQSSELHSVLATEVLDLPAALEAYYAIYFKDRKKIVNLSMAVETELGGKKKQIEEMDVKIKALGSRILNQKKNISSLVDKIKDSKDHLQRLAADGNIEEHNALVPETNALINQFEELASKYQQNVKNLNFLIKKEIRWSSTFES